MRTSGGARADEDKAREASEGARATSVQKKKRVRRLNPSISDCKIECDKFFFHSKYSITPTKFVID
jgi:hypothetical protein